MISAILAAAVLLAETTTAAAPPAPAQTPPAAAPAKPSKPDRNAVVCHTERVLGSNIPTRVCVSQAQAEDRAQHDREAVEQQQTGPH